jgi:hypothetical protein
MTTRLFAARPRNAGSGGGAGTGTWVRAGTSLVIVFAFATVSLWNREHTLLQRLSTGASSAAGLPVARVNSTSAWDLATLFRRWTGSGQTADAAEDEDEVQLAAVTPTIEPIGADGGGGGDGEPAPAALRGGEWEDGGGNDTGGGGGAAPPPSQQQPPPPPRDDELPPDASLPEYADRSYRGPPTLGGRPDPREDEWLLKAAPGTDVQIRRDLAPWRRGGISMEEIRLTKRGRGALKLANDTVWDQPRGLFTCVLWDGVPYFFVTEVRYMLTHFIFGAVLKILDFLRLLFNVGKHAKLPNTLFLWNADPWPLLKGKPSHGAHAPRPSAPILSLCKTDGDWDVLYPSMYFRTREFWGNATASLGGAARAHPWRQRLPKVWWRGSAGKFWPGSAPRVVTVGTYYRRPWADFAFTGVNQWEWSLKHWRRTPLWRKLPPGTAKIPYGKQYKMNMEAVARYRYALHLPGFYYATYSRMLQFLLWSGTAVFVYDCPYYEFYYHRLRPWVHYIPTNLTALPARYLWAQSNPEIAARIAANGLALVRQHLGGGDFVAYWGQLLAEYHKLLGFRLASPPKGLCTCFPDSGGGGKGRRGRGKGGDGADGPKPPKWVTVPGARHCGVLCSDRLIIKTGIRAERRLSEDAPAAADGGRGAGDRRGGRPPAADPARGRDPRPRVACARKQSEGYRTSR